MALQLGTPVTYRDSDGFEKLAFVTGTRKTVSKDGSATRPDKGAGSLFVVSLTGSTYHRANIPAGDGPRTFSPVG